MRNYAGFWLRFVAAIIDGVILSIINWIVGLVLGGGITSALLSIIVGWVYFASLESSNKQATLGKLALGLTVTDITGRQISFGKATGRFFAKYISAFILCIGYIMAGFTEKKQALHDLIVGTLVLRGDRIQQDTYHRNDNDYNSYNDMDTNSYND